MGKRFLKTSAADEFRSKNLKSSFSLQFLFFNEVKIILEKELRYLEG